MMPRKALIYGMAFLAVCSIALTLACGTAVPAKTTSGDVTTPGVAETIEVTLDGIKVADITATEIASLPSASLTVNGVDRKGATLASVLDYIGIVSYMGVTASGMSPEHTEVFAELDEQDLASEIIFSSNNGVVSIFGSNVEPECWDMDITSIAVIACNCGVG